jgi:hypothetical protein
LPLSKNEIGVCTKRPPAVTDVAPQARSSALGDTIQGFNLDVKLFEDL